MLRNSLPLASLVHFVQMLKRYLSIAATLAVILVARADSDDPVGIKWDPKLGSETKYDFKLTVTSHEGAEKGTIEYRWDLSQTVKEKDKDGNFVLEDVATNLKVRVDDAPVKEENNGQKDLKITAKRTYKPNGELLDAPDVETNENKKPEETEDTDDPADWIPEMIYPSSPVSEGDDWKRITPGDETPADPTTETKYIYTGIERVHAVRCYKVDLEMHETKPDTGGTGSGSMWVSAEDGTVQKVKWKMKDYSGGEEGVKCDIEVEAEVTDGSSASIDEATRCTQIASQVRDLALRRIPLHIWKARPPASSAPFHVRF